MQKSGRAYQVEADFGKELALCRPGRGEERHRALLGCADLVSVGQSLTHQTLGFVLPRMVAQQTDPPPGTLDTCGSKTPSFILSCPSLSSLPSRQAPALTLPLPCSF